MTHVQQRSIDGVNRTPVKRTRVQRMRRSIKRSRPLQFVLFLFILGMIIGLGLSIARLVSPPNYDDVTTVTNAVAKHVVIPDEKPILATVTDKTALKTPFLQEADNGDRILLYEKAKKVIIYRPSIDRIVNIGPIELSNIPKT